MVSDAIEAGMVHLWPTVNPISDLEDLHSSHGRLMQIQAFTRTNPKQISPKCALEPHRIFWVTDRNQPDSIRPTLENLYSVVDRTISSEKGIIWLEGVELLVRVNGFDAVLKFVRSIVDLSQNSQWSILIVGAPGTMDKEQWARLRREAPTIGRLDSIRGPEQQEDEVPAEIGIYAQEVEKDIPPMLSRLPPDRMDLITLDRRCTQWGEFGFDVSPLRDAINVDVVLSREVYHLLESKIRMATECLSQIERAGNLISSPDRIKMRFRCFQLTELEKVRNELDAMEKLD
jgi:hypothetical protein